MLLLHIEQSERLHTQACIRFIRYEGVQAKTGTRANVIKEYTIEAPLMKQIERAKEIIQSQLRDFTVSGQNAVVPS